MSEQQRVRMTHPDLPGAAITVRPATATVHAHAGWRETPAEDTPTQDTPATAGDTPPGATGGPVPTPAARPAPTTSTKEGLSHA